MAIDTKEVMAEAVARLLFEKNVKRLTVKNIVEECSITRQAFYYHFADIPELLRWIIVQKSDEMGQEIRKLDTPEEKIRYWLLLAVNCRTDLQKGLESNYGQEVGQFFIEEMMQLFKTILLQEKECSVEEMDSFDRNLIIRHHFYGLLGLIKDWTQEDQDNLDRIVRDVYLLMAGQPEKIAKKAE